MKIKKLIFACMVLCSIAFPSCQKEKVKGCTDSSATNFDSKAEENDGTCKYEGTVTFWMDGSVTTNGEVDVVINGTSQQITLDLTSSPSCGATGCATFKLAPGTYNFVAEDQSPVSYQITGTFTVEKNGCLKYLLK